MKNVKIVGNRWQTNKKITDTHASFSKNRVKRATFLEPYIL